MKKNRPKQYAVDQLGEVIVTPEEVDQWLDAVPKLSRASPRREYYIKYWNVVSKIKAAKKAGKFEAIIEAGAAWGAG